MEVKKRKEKKKKKKPRVGVRRRSSFSSENLRLPKKLDLHRTPLVESVAMLASLSFSPPCLEFSSGGVSMIMKILASEEPIS